MEQIQSITLLRGYFKSNTIIKEFKELEKFSSLTKLSDGEFLNCTNLIEIVLPDSITILESNLHFSGCSKLRTINLDNLVRIGNSSFYNCSNLSIGLNLPNLTTLGSGAFNRSGIVEIINLGKVTEIGAYDTNDDNSQFYGCKNLSKVSLNSNIVRLRNFTFGQCTSLKEFSFDKNSITSIGNSSFNNCSAEFDVDFPNLSSLANGAFIFSNIKRVLDLGNVTSISSGNDGNKFNACFYGCTNLSFVKLKDIITTIGNNVFNGCSKLSVVICNPITPPSLGANVFGNTSPDLKIYVPDDSVEAYKTATNWITYANLIHPLSEYVE